MNNWIFYTFYDDDGRTDLFENVYLLYMILFIDNDFMIDNYTTIIINKYVVY